VCGGTTEIKRRGDKYQELEVHSESRLSRTHCRDGIEEGQLALVAPSKKEPRCAKKKLETRARVKEVGGKRAQKGKRSGTTTLGEGKEKVGSAPTERRSPPVRKR